MTSLRPTLPGSAYTDPYTFDSERERIFEANWFCAVASSDIPTPGSFRTVTVGRESVLITRSRTGEARAFLNVCRHRGSRLCPDKQGIVGNIVCPYHQWTYELDGRLLYARDMGPDFDATKHGLRPVACEDAAGMVFICLAETPPENSAMLDAAHVARPGRHVIGAAALN